MTERHSSAMVRHGFLALLLLVASTSAHSWIESAVKIAPNGSFVGNHGFPRGYIARDQPGWNDKLAQHLIPDGQAYTGNELLTKSPLEPNPRYPLLEAAPGDNIAIFHLENGHVTLPQNKANKPLNRGNLYLYGTSRPKPQERIFDVHLRWNPEGSGGDGRGRLLATRNYDDGQCFQDNQEAIAKQRVSKLAPDGAVLGRELKCQSTLRLPSDLQPGSIYTIYWYWDWPTLNPAKIDMEATKRGRFPWAGSFLRGDPMPNGWTVGAIALNESYSSVIDIKIAKKPPGVVAKDAAATLAWVDKQNIYNKAIKAQVDNSFQVKADVKPSESSAPAPPTAPSVAPSAMPPSGSKPAAGCRAKPSGGPAPPVAPPPPAVSSPTGSKPAGCPAKPSGGPSPPVAPPPPAVSSPTGSKPAAGCRAKPSGGPSPPVAPPPPAVSSPSGSKPAGCPAKTSGSALSPLSPVSPSVSAPTVPPAAPPSSVIVSPSSTGPAAGCRARLSSSAPVNPGESPTGAPKPLLAQPSPPVSPGGNSTQTVTTTVTQPPSTVTQTIYATEVPVENSSSASSSSVIVDTSTMVVTQTTSVTPDGTPAASPGVVPRQPRGRLPGRRR